jgi:hypothetical protein
MDLNDEEFKVFEKEGLAFLRTLDFTPIGYFPYEHFSDASGYLKPSPPFRIPTKTMVEIVKGSPTPESIDGFYKLAKDSLANLMIIICPKRFTDLSQGIQNQINRSRIEFFDQEMIEAALKEKKISKSTIQEYSELYDIVGAPLLAAALPNIAQQKIPEEMKEHVERLGLKPWQVFEAAVFSVFHYCFNCATQKLGEECLFEHEPEGIVVIGDALRFALIYECKSAKESYTMTADHELRYKDYIQKKTNEIRVLHGATLKYFAVIAPEFSGDIHERREKIFSDTQVLTIFLPASVLSSLGTWACKLPSDIKRLIDLKSIFKLDEDIVMKSTVENYIKEFERNIRRR